MHGHRAGWGRRATHPQKPGGKRRTPGSAQRRSPLWEDEGLTSPVPGAYWVVTFCKADPTAPTGRFRLWARVTESVPRARAPREPVNPPQSGDGQSPPPRGSNGTGETTQELHRMGAECPEHSVFTSPGWPGEKPGSLGEGQRVTGNCAQHGHAIRGWLTAVHAAVGPANARFSIPRLRSPKSNFLLPGKGDRGPSR